MVEQKIGVAKGEERRWTESSEPREITSTQRGNKGPSHVPDGPNSGAETDDLSITKTQGLSVTKLGSHARGCQAKYTLE